MIKTVVISVDPEKGMECFTTFRKVCKAKGWNYQTMSNTGRVPKIQNPITQENIVIHRVKVQ